MTKRELLELAAKAAGIDYREDRIELDGRYGLTLNQKNLPDNYSTWNAVPVWDPIDFNNDAFQLALKLGLVVDFGSGSAEKVRLEIVKQAAGCYCVEHHDSRYFSLGQAITV